MIILIGLTNIQKTEDIHITKIEHGHSKNDVGESTADKFTVKSVRAVRSILSYIGCAETGVLDVRLLLSRGSKSKKSAEYDSEMNKSALSHWCDFTVWPKLVVVFTKEKSVIQTILFCHREHLTTNYDLRAS